MSKRTRDRGKKEKAIRRAAAEQLRLEGVISRYHERLPKLEDRLEHQRKIVKEAES